MGASWALAELGNQQVPKKHPREFTDAQRPEISLQDEFFYGCCRGTCGTGNQQVPKKHPREFTDAQRPEITLQDERLTGAVGALAELE